MNPTLELFSLQGRVALVSGASRGIGRAIALGLAGAGATVYGVGRTPPGSVEEPGDERVRYRQADATDAAAFAAVCDESLREGGRLDVYVHAAAISVPPAAELTEPERFSRTIGANLVAAYECNVAAAQRMALAGQGGAIVNVTSINSLQGFPGNPGYVAAKGGLRSMTQALALDLADRGIRVNNLAPGYVRTAMTEQSFQDTTRHEERRARTILGRWGKPEDLVGAAVFLASAASAYVTGQDLVVDGGWTVKGL